MHLEQNCREIEFFRSLIIDGQFKEAEVFLELFKPIPMFPYKQCLFELKKQQFFELLELNDDVKSCFIPTKYDSFSKINR